MSDACLPDDQPDAPVREMSVKSCRFTAVARSATFGTTVLILLYKIKDRKKHDGSRKVGRSRDVLRGSLES